MSANDYILFHCEFLDVLGTLGMNLPNRVALLDFNHHMHILKSKDMQSVGPRSFPTGEHRAHQHPHNTFCLEVEEETAQHTHPPTHTALAALNFKCVMQLNWCLYLLFIADGDYRKQP
jgi:hypothetical protein